MLQHGQYARGGATCARPHLKHAQPLPLRKLRDDVAHRSDDATVVELRDGRLLVYRLDQVHGATGEEEALVGCLARKRGGEVRPTALDELDRWRQLWMLLAQLLGQLRHTCAWAGALLSGLRCAPRIQLLVEPLRHLRLRLHRV